MVAIARTEPSSLCVVELGELAEMFNVSCSKGYRTLNPLRRTLVESGRRFLSSAGADQQQLLLRVRRLLPQWPRPLRGEPPATAVATSSGGQQLGALGHAFGVLDPLGVLVEHVVGQVPGEVDHLRVCSRTSGSPWPSTVMDEMVVPAVEGGVNP